MIGSLIVVGFFVLGCVLGWSGLIPDWIAASDLSTYVLYLADVSGGNEHRER